MDVADVVQTVITIGGAILAVAAGVSAIYIQWVYRQRHEEALFLSRLVTRDIRVAVASVVILGYIVLNFLGYGLGKPWGSLIISVSIMVMMFGPISDALLWRKERRDKK